MIDATKLRIPVGSLAVDLALVLSLIFWSGRMTEKLDQMHARLQAVEAMRITPEADRRISVQESKTAGVEQQLERIDSKLDRIEDLLTRKVDK